MSGMWAKSNIFVFLVGLVFLTNIGGFFSAEMMMDGSMQDCPYMGVTGLCDMSPLEHLSQWQAMTTATPQPFFAALLLLFITFVIVWNFLNKPFVLRPKEAYIPRYRFKKRVPNVLQFAFARGILNTKRY